MTGKFDIHFLWERCACVASVPPLPVRWTRRNVLQPQVCPCAVVSFQNGVELVGMNSWRYSKMPPTIQVYGEYGTCIVPRPARREGFGLERGIQLMIFWPYPGVVASQPVGI